MVPPTRGHRLVTLTTSSVDIKIHLDRDMQLESVSPYALFVQNQLLFRVYCHRFPLVLEGHVLPNFDTCESMLEYALKYGGKPLNGVHR